MRAANSMSTTFSGHRDSGACLIVYLIAWDGVNPEPARFGVASGSVTNVAELDLEEMTRLREGLGNLLTPNSRARPVRFEDHGKSMLLVIEETNWGEPYEEGVLIRIEVGERKSSISLEMREALRLHGFLEQIMFSMI